MPISQSNRLISVSTPLGEDVLLFRRMTGSEEISQLFEYQLELLGENNRIVPAQILGQNICVCLTVKDGKHRYFNGFVSHFGYAGTDGEYNRYRAVIKPWLWLLTRQSNCRIFQNMSIPEIVTQVCSDSGFSDIENQLSERYSEMTYCVQYRETDFNFVSRLLEEIGIAYYFKHEKNKHNLVLADSISAYDNVSGYKTIPYFPADANVQLREEDHIHEWSPWQQVASGNYVLNDYDFEKPKASLISKSTDQKDYSYAEFEQYDYPGEYVENADGDKLVSSRMQELHSHSVGIHGSGNIRGMTNGALFDLENFPVDDQNREHLIISTHFFLQSDRYSSAQSTEGVECQCKFLAIDSRQSFIPRRMTPKPVIQGPQTAVVVGPSGEEIYTDKYGRVKVQFHWDREGKMDENSSCWVRVSHPTAGKNWGGVQIPRIGQEVIVHFLEGNPNQPMVTGRVYNAGQMPPFELPSKKMVAGMKSNSTPGGGGYNEFSMDDTNGNELITVHGQFDMDSTIENDLREHVLHDRSRDVANNETVKVGNNQDYSIGSNQTGLIGVNKSVTVGSNHTEAIGSNQTITVASNKTETVGINTAETIGAAKELTIGAAYAVTVGAAMNEAIGAAKAEEIGAAKSVNVGLDSSENIGKNKSLNAGDSITESAGKDVSVSSGKKMSYIAGDDYTVSGAKKGVITMADELTIKVGKATINMKKNGDITINGKKITMKGSGNVMIKGKKILEN